VKALRLLKEFRDFKAGDITIGKEVKVDLFTKGDKVSVTAKSKGKGFQGVVRRHHFSGVGMTTHGQSDRVRAPGSIVLRRIRRGYSKECVWPGEWVSGM